MRPISRACLTFTGLLPKIDAALHYFEQALEADPNYALAYVGISFVWGCREQFGLVMPSEATPKAKAAAQRALELDDTLPEVHYKWAGIKTWSDWNWETGEQAFKRALELKPNFAEALAYYSNLLCYMDRLDEALGKVVYQYGKRSSETESMDYP